MSNIRQQFIPLWLIIQRSLQRISGGCDRARSEFWRFLYHALAQHRERFAEAVRLAAMGYHFRKLTEGLYE